MVPLDCAFLPMAIRCIWEFTLPSSEILQVFSYFPPLRNFFDLQNEYIYLFTLQGNKISLIISNETIFTVSMAVHTVHSIFQVPPDFSQHPPYLHWSDSSPPRSDPVVLNITWQFMVFIIKSLEETVSKNKFRKLRKHSVLCVK